MLRAACGLDIPALLALEDALFPNSMTERMLQHELHRGQGWVAEVDDELVGYILVRRDESLLDITRLGVVEKVRRQGVAKQLLERALSEPGDVVLTVKKDNAPAIALYRRYGFEIVAHLAAAHAWVMKLTRASM
jgi:ribosomal-protein-alanine N-acetyltransferase